VTADDTSASSDGVLVVWNDVAAAAEEEYNAWYWAQHLPERVGIPGFLAGRRYIADSPGPRYFTWYPLRSIDVLRSAAYLERLENPTEWTRRMMPFFRNMCRTGCHLRADLGAGMGASALVLPVTPVESAAPDAFAAHVADTVFPVLSDVPGFVRAQLWQGDAALSRSATAESALRHREDDMAGWTIFVEATDRATLDRAAGVLAGPALTDAATPETLVFYRLLHALP
jgi:hypothetical protein